MQIITSSNGQKVDCYGPWHEDSNVECIFEDEEFDGIWADGADSWEEAVEILTNYAQKNGTIVIELMSC